MKIFDWFWRWVRRRVLLHVPTSLEVDDLLLRVDTQSDRLDRISRRLQAYEEAARPYILFTGKRRVSKEIEVEHTWYESTHPEGHQAALTLFAGGDIQVTHAGHHPVRIESIELLSGPQYEIGEVWFGNLTVSQCVPFGRKVAIPKDLQEVQVGNTVRVLIRRLVKEER